MVFLVESTLDLSVGALGPANEVAVYAFYALLLGVVLQIVSSWKYRRGMTELE
jgi:hypothetical protein